MFGLIDQVVAPLDAIGDVVKEAEQHHVLGYPPQVVAVAGIDGQLVRQGDRSRQHAPTGPAERRADHVAPRVDEARNAGIGAARHGTAVLNRAQTRKREVLAVNGRIAPPAVVGDDQDQLRPAADELAHVGAVDRFVADGRRHPHAVGRKDRALRGVMATQQILVLLFKVQILVSQQMAYSTNG